MRARHAVRAVSRAHQARHEHRRKGMDRVSSIKLMSLVAAVGFATGCASTGGAPATPDLTGGTASAATEETTAAPPLTAPPAPPPPPPAASATTTAPQPECAEDDEDCLNDSLGF